MLLILISSTLILFVGFNPGSVSTPIGQRHMSPVWNNDQQPGFQYSHKHNGLYLFLSRTMRPIWRARVVHCIKMDSKMQWVWWL